MDSLLERLTRIFLGELSERVHALNRDLLALEKGCSEHEAAELLVTLFRTAHSLKGAAGSIDATLIEVSCHKLEEIFVAIQNDRLALNPNLFRLFFVCADAIQDAGRRLQQGEDLSASPLARLLPQLEAAVAGVSATHSEAATDSPTVPTDTATVPAVAAGREWSRADGFARVPTQKLDTLMVRNGELLSARRRTDMRSGDVAELQTLVRDWRAGWPVLDKALASLTRIEAEAADNAHEKAAARDARRLAQAVSQSKANAERLEKELDRLGTALIEDRKLLDQAAGHLDGEVRRIRMLPFAEACEGLERTVRDLARPNGKFADLVIEGGDIELDRSVLDGLRDPLLHLVRNAVDHGIEPTDIRRARGKPLAGRITITAALHGDNIEISVADDGPGLDIEAIRGEARRKQLPDASESEVAQHIFLAGFSTVQLATEVSGRGVGLDSVKASVEALRGTVEVSYVPGRGTRFAFTLPLTLTTIRAVLVAAGDQSFAVERGSVVKVLQIRRQDVHSVEGREMLALGGPPVPVVMLAAALGLPSRESMGPEAKLQVLLLAAGRHTAGFVVDELFGEQEVLVRSLGTRIMRVKNVSGATVLPSGRIILILNPAHLVGTAVAKTLGPRIVNAEAGSARDAKRRVLLAEDSVTTRTLEKEILEVAGYGVIAAVDGAEAWRLLQEKGADIVITDVDMPHMNGFLLTEAIRGSKRFKNLPVILVTGQESEEDKVRGMEAGANAYLLKSAFDQKALLETIGQLL
jgi:two-component system, chemotaxis family, sensor kinase CheA